MPVKYFATVAGQVEELPRVNYVPRDPAKRFRNEQNIIIGARVVKADAYTFAVGRASDGQLYAAERVVQRKANPSNHKCGAKCRHATGKVCECECGGKFHGAGK